jgi:hypothetical protein
MTHEPRRSPFDLASDAFQDVGALLSTEARLLRAEISTKVSQVISALGMMLIAAVFFLGALVLLLQAGVALLMEWGLSALTASIAVAAMSMALGLLLYFASKNALSADRLIPQRAMNQINRDVAMAREAAARR